MRKVDVHVESLNNSVCFMMPRILKNSFFVFLPLILAALFAITIDFDTLKQAYTVILRERDSLRQIRATMNFTFLSYELIFQ